MCRAKEAPGLPLNYEAICGTFGSLRSTILKTSRELDPVETLSVSQALNAANTWMLAAPSAVRSDTMGRMSVNGGRSPTSTIFAEISDHREARRVALGRGAPDAHRVGMKYPAGHFIAHTGAIRNRSRRARSFAREGTNRSDMRVVGRSLRPVATCHVRQRHGRLPLRASIEARSTQASQPIDHRDNGTNGDMRLSSGYPRSCPLHAAFAFDGRRRYTKFGLVSSKR